MATRTKRTGPRDRGTPRRISEFGSMYRGREGQWSWIAHRVTGVAIILFLFAHVVDTAVAGWGPNAYNKVIAVYRNPLVGLLELVLVACVRSEERRVGKECR